MIDIKENKLIKIDKNLIDLLLIDKSSKKNIIWATDNYQKYGAKYCFNSEITADLITGHRGTLVKPRVKKNKQDQLSRIRNKAEVFTPSWICNIQNNLIDDIWFDGCQKFNIEEDEGWKTLADDIIFSHQLNKTWKDYVKEKRLEISCGEAPYLASRYDTVSGNYIPVNERIGFLDRKLRVVHENTNTIEDWLTWAYAAITSVYGYDWQGDNVLIARENMLFDVAEHFENKFHKKIETQDLIGFAKVVAWNIWQMDGLKYVIPNSCSEQEKKEITLFEEIVTSTACEGCKKSNKFKHNGTYCIIKDWDTRRTIRFVDLMMERKK